MQKAMEAANAIFRAAYTAVLPHRLVRNAISVDSDQMLTVTAAGRRYPLRKNVFVAAFGKAASGMARAVDDILHEHIVDGVVSVPRGTEELFRRDGLRNLLPREDTVLRYYEGAVNNLPDENAYRAALEVKVMVERLTKEHLLLVLISGGGSALLPCPVPSVSLDEKTRMIKLLSQRGADIGELNTVRQNLSQLKGGRLAQLAAGKTRRVISLIISDIIGDPLEFIASGPTFPRRTKPSDALVIIRKYEGTIEHEKECIPKNILTYLENAKDDTVEGSNISDHVDSVIIGNNRTALEAAQAEAERYHYHAQIVDSSVTGVAKMVGQDHARRLDDFLSNATAQKRCWLWGGETTVRVKGPGRGGRNQEMVLSFALEAVRLKLTDKYPNTKFAFLSAGTDGQDGPTDAAGAVIGSDQLSGLEEKNAKVMEECLERNDSYTFFDKFNQGRCHVKCGLTGTNVMDVQVMVLDVS